MTDYSRFTGIFPAVNVPMNVDYSINYEAFQEHVEWLSTFDIGGLVLNGHAGEVESLTDQERAEVIETARKVSNDLPIIAGTTGLSTGAAVETAKYAKKAGADALLVLPIPHFAFGATDSPRLVLPYFESLAEATGLPMVLFRYAEDTGLMYSDRVVMEVARQVPLVMGIKDVSGRYERSWVDFQTFDRKINVLPAQGDLFLSRFRTSDGAISSFSNVAPEFVIELYKASRDGRHDDALVAWKRIQSLSSAIYDSVETVQHWVMEKEILTARGRFTQSTARPPFQPLTTDQKELVKKAVDAAGLS